MTFITLTEQVGLGEPAPESWIPVAELPLCILVGVTGVGKTSLCRSLLTHRSCRLLPERRVLTDRFILPTMGLLPEEGGYARMDRLQRFEATRAFRAEHPGGMGDVLSRVHLKDLGKELLLFDGLRGVEEVRYAAAHLPRAVFVVLIAPDWIRVQRLLSRQDAFDAATEDPEDPETLPFETLCSQEQKQALLHFCQVQGIDRGQMAEKMRIVIKERENYDQEGTQRFLQKTIPEQTMVIDSSRFSQEAIGPLVWTRLHDLGAAGMGNGPWKP